MILKITCSILLTLLLTLPTPTTAVCINKECPFQCCIDNLRCNPRPDCMKEVEEFCVSSEECYSGCCHGSLCREGKKCDDYVLTVGLTLGLFYFCVFLIVCAYFNLKRKKEKKLKTFLMQRENNPAAKKLAQLFQGHIGKAAGLQPPPNDLELENLNKSSN